MEAGFGGRIVVRRPHLQPQNKRTRLHWAKKKEQLTVDGKVFFGLKNQSYKFLVQRKVGVRMMKQCVVPTVKHGEGSLIVWGCYNGNNTEDIVKIDGIMMKEVFLGILKNHSFIQSAIPSRSLIIGKPFIFQEVY